MFEKLWKVTAGLVVIGLVAGLVVWWINREPRREMTPLMRGLAEQVSEELAQRLPREQTINTALVLVVGRGNRDEEQQFRDMLLRSVVASDKYKVRDWGDVQRLIQRDAGWYGTFLQKTGLVPGEPPMEIGHAAEALEWLDRTGQVMDGIILIDVTSFTEGPHKDGLGARVSVEGKVWSRHVKKVVAEVAPITHSIESAWDLRYLSYSMSQQSVILRFLGWFVIACSLPWLGLQVIRAALRRKDNGANGAVLGGLVVLDLLAAWVFLFAFGTGGWTLLGLLLVGGLMAYYNYDAVDYISRRLL